MARYSAGGRTSSYTPSATVPAIGIFATASVTPYIVEIGVFNTTTTGLVVNLARTDTSTGTATGAAETAHRANRPAATATVKYDFSALPTVQEDLGYRAAIGAAIGAGIVWTFGDGGLEVHLGANEGICVMVPVGTGQHLDCYIVWDE